MGSIRRGQTGNRDGRDGRMPSGLPGNVANKNFTGNNLRSTLLYALRGLYALPDLHNNPHR
jgi:hypothetical protein